MRLDQLIVRAEVEVGGMAYTAMSEIEAGMAAGLQRFERIAEEGDGGEAEQRLQGTLMSRGWRIIEDAECDKKGVWAYCTPLLRLIGMSTMLPVGARASVLAHEATHGMYHSMEEIASIGLDGVYKRLETEAEGVGWLVARGLGVDSTPWSALYIARVGSLGMLKTKPMQARIEMMAQAILGEVKRYGW